MYNRGTMICLSVTGITTLLLFFYFRNKISQVEDKLDKVFDIIQDYSTNDRQSQEFVVREAPPPQNSQPVVMSTPGFERSDLIEVSEDEDDKVKLGYNTNNKSSDDENDDDSDSDSEDDDSDSDSEDEEPEQPPETTEEPKEEVIVEATLEVETDELTPKIEKDEKQPEDTEEDSEEDSEEETEEDSEEEDGGKNNLGNSDNDGEDVKKVSLEPTPDYSTMTVATLKDICSDKGLRGYKSLRKNDLVTLLEESYAN
jgi:hypothetical protein